MDIYHIKCIFRWILKNFVKNFVFKKINFAPACFLLFPLSREKNKKKINKSNYLYLRITFRYMADMYFIQKMSLYFVEFLSLLTTSKDCG